ncbi:serine/threonine protein kinase [Archangium gephyra]|uniref:Serine/threonine protein kinase n=1 Tax=Archangium gephyra TaxID=48 RepID=A0AAC8Q4E4_9BACT|nr:tetratricopeptide repeat protein [Archangium gephyra]AKJ00667.1 Serine/threonine protein kinase [Archangium gephyra]REG20711.1 serine/threonine protein kinase [Archangium gephyra]
MTSSGSERRFVGRYKLLRSITPVGRDETYEALDEERQQHVTVRLVRTGRGDLASLERLEHELHRARDVVSPHVQRILEVGRHHDEVSGVELSFLATERLEGESLEERLRQSGPLTPQEALPLARQLCEGLATLHDAGLVHGDLRSARVMLIPAPEGTRAVLAAPAWGWESANPPATALHLAPERHQGTEPTSASDLYSLGLILLELLAGALSSPDSETMALLELLRRGSASSQGLGLPHRWEVVIRRCMDPLPRKRFTSAREVVRTLVQPSGVPRPLDEPSVAIRTVLLLDLTDSTRLVESLGDARAAELFARHDQLARELLHVHGGQEIDKTDGFLLLFERPVDATRYALAYHERLAMLEREQGVKLQARAGIHLGEVVLRENPPHLVAQGAKPVDVEGLTKLIAARIMPLAHGGQTLMSRAAFDIARRAVVGTSGTGPGLSWRAHGFYLLAGVEEPVEVCEVGVVGKAPLVAPQDTAKARRITLSSPSLPAIPTIPGRPERSRRVPAVLLVLCALVLAALAGYAARTWSLSPSASGPGPRQVTPRRAVAVLGFKNLSGRAEVSWLSTAFSEMLTAELTVREDLRLVSGETVVRMKRELSLADSESLAPDTLHRIRSHLGVDMVVLGSYLAMTDDMGGRLSLVLRLQDASNGEEVAMLRENGTQAEILELVARMGDQLRGRLGPTADAGHTTGALPANATALRLYAEGLARLRASEPLKARDFFTQALAADPRFALAHSALAETWAVLGYDTRALEAASRALALAKGLSREEQLLVEGRLHEMEKDWAKAVDSYRTLSALFPDDLDHGLRLASAQASGGQGRDALVTLAALRQMAPSTREDERIDLAEAQVRHSLSDYKGVLPLAARAVRKGTERGSRLLVGRARLAQCNALLRLGHHADATTACQQALRIFVDAGDPRSEGDTLNRLANVAYEEGNYEEAKRVFSEALRIWKDIDHRSGVALAQQNIADTLLMQGELAQAEPLFEQALAIQRDINDRRTEGLTLSNLAQLRLMRGDVARARKPAEEGVRLSRETGYRYALVVGLWTLGNLALEEGHPEEARRHYAEGLTLSRQTQDDRYTAYLLQGSGQVALLEGDLVSARRQYEEALGLRHKLEGRSEVAETQVALGLLAVEEGRPEAALEPLLAAVETLRGLGLPDGEAQAHTALALVHLARNQPALAREASARAQALAARSQHVQTRLGSALMAARVLTAEGRHGEAVKRLEAVLAETRRTGLVPLEYEARLALAEAERAWGRLPLAWQRLKVLEEDARTRGLSGFVREAEALGNDLRGGGLREAAPR